MLRKIIKKLKDKVKIVRLILYMRNFIQCVVSLWMIVINIVINYVYCYHNIMQNLYLNKNTIQMYKKQIQQIPINLDLPTQIITY
jgi:hypothetical protein